MINIQRVIDGYVEGKTKLVEAVDNYLLRAITNFSDSKEFGNMVVQNKKKRFRWSPDLSLTYASERLKRLINSLSKDIQNEKDERIVLLNDLHKKIRNVIDSFLRGRVDYKDHDSIVEDLCCVGEKFFIFKEMELPNILKEAINKSLENVKY